MTVPGGFSRHTQRYKEFRPTYPDELFRYLNSLVAARDLAWDCATGNGQAALGLTPYFGAVVATDASKEQLANATSDPKVSYCIAQANWSPLPDHSIDLVTVASAFHWLEHARFYAEVRRVVRPHGILAAWGYKMPRVSPEVDAVVERFDSQVIRSFWLPVTRLVVEQYRTIPFPFDEIVAPPFQMIHKWDMDRLLGYLSSWSASLLYWEQNRRNPTDEIRQEMTLVWGDPSQVRKITWDLCMRVGRVIGH